MPSPGGRRLSHRISAHGRVLAETRTPRGTRKQQPGTYGHREVSPGDGRHVDLVALPKAQGLVAGMGRRLTLTAGRRKAKGKGKATEVQP